MHAQRPMPARRVFAAIRRHADFDFDPDICVVKSDEDEDGGFCGACNGSGEGMYDGSTCQTCGGSGEF